MQTKPEVQVFAGKCPNCRGEAFTVIQTIEFWAEPLIRPESKQIESSISWWNSEHIKPEQLSCDGCDWSATEGSPAMAGWSFNS